MTQSISILTIDVGLKNLAMCIGNVNEKDKNLFDIQLWNVFDTLGADESQLCAVVQKNSKICNKKCNYKYLDKETQRTIFTCKKHFPKDIPIKKSNTITVKKIDSYLLQDIASIVLKKIQEIHDQNLKLFQNLSKVLIELQPKVNQKMKFVSHIIYGKLVELIGESTDIRFVRAAQKLKAYKGPYIECKLKSKYAQRKWLSVKYTEWFLKNKMTSQQCSKWTNFFTNCSKKDDLGDVYLMCINGLYGTPTKTTKKGKCIK